MKIKRLPAEQDLPNNAAELVAIAKREACIAADIRPEQFGDHDHRATVTFASVLLANVSTGDHPYCVRNVLGESRANAMLGRDLDANGVTDLRRHHPTWPARAARKAQGLLAVWDSDEQKGRAA